MRLRQASAASQGPTPVIRRLCGSSGVAYAVGYRGSMLWFGSSAGVALANVYPEAISVGRWLTHAWHVPVAYLAGFAVLMAVLGWRATVEHHDVAPPARSAVITLR